jgi:hypothetical protein
MMTKKKILLSTVGAVLVLGFTPAFAAAKYTFADDSGDAYCDGITLKESAGIAVGTHTGCAGDTYAGGFEVKFPGGTTNVWDVTTTDDNIGDAYQLVYVVDQKTLTWFLYYQSTENSVTFQYINSGELLVGAPADIEASGKTLGTKTSAGSALKH